MSCLSPGDLSTAMTVRTGCALSPRYCLTFHWISRRGKLNLPSTPTCRGLAKKVLEYKLRLAACASRADEKKHRNRTTKRLFIPTGSLDTSSACWTCRLRLSQVGCRHRSAPGYFKSY